MNFQNNYKQFLHSSTQSESEDMAQKEMDDLQEAINQSKELRSLEEQQRKSFYKHTVTSDNVEEPVKEKPFTPKQWTKKSKLSSSSGDSIKSEKQLSTEEVSFTFQDLLVDSGKSLDIIYHKPVFDLPIPTNPQYKKYNLQQKTQLLVNYYTKVDKLRAELAKQSLYHAPTPQPIMPSIRCKNSLLKTELDDENGSFDDFFEQESTAELYVSRAGRQVKRKIYTEDTEGDSDFELASTNKKNRSDNSDTKIILDTPYIPEENHTEDKSKLVKTRKDTPRRPSALSMRKPLNRSEVLFDKVLESEEKKKHQEEEMEHFEKTLPNLDEIEEDSFTLDISPVKETAENTDTNFIRRRVVPPLPVKKGGIGKKAGKQDIEDRQSVSPPGSPELRRYCNPKQTSENKPKPKTQQKRKGVQSKESSSKLEKTPCPICNREFLQSEIMNHASTCGLDECPIGAESTRSSARQITCDLCNKILNTPTEYEIHVKQCMAATISKM